MARSRLGLMEKPHTYGLSGSKLLVGVTPVYSED